MTSIASGQPTASPIHTVRANGLDIAYQSFGSPAATPVLLIMGLGTQMPAWPDGLCEMLAARGHLVIRFDNRDVGLSSHLDAAGNGRPLSAFAGLVEPAYRLTDMAKDTAGLIDAIGLRSVHVVGVSMGGMIAQTLTLMRPDMVRSLTSMSSTTGAIRVGLPRPSVLAKLLTGRPADTREGAIANTVAMYRRTGSPGFPSDEPLLRHVAGVAYDRCYDPAGAARQFSAILAAPDRTRALGRVTAPTTVIHGTSDPLINVTGGLATAAAVPGSRLVTIAGMGHDLPQALWPRFSHEISHTVATGEDRRDADRRPDRR